MSFGGKTPVKKSISRENNKSFVMKTTVKSQFGEHKTEVFCVEARSGQNSDNKIVSQDSLSATVIPFNSLSCIFIGNTQQLFSVCF